MEENDCIACMYHKNILIFSALAHNFIHLTGQIAWLREGGERGLPYEKDGDAH